MNVVILTGRLTRDPEVRYANESQTAIARFSLAVDRPFSRDEEKKADFPSVVCFGKTAELVEKYVTKGKKIGVTGRLQTGSYTNKDGVKVYTTDVVADRVEFLEKKDQTDAAAVESRADSGETADVYRDFEKLEDDVPF